jgi:thioredoxin 1
MIREASNNFESEITSGTILVEVYTPMCRPCNIMKETVLPNVETAEVLTVNAVQNPNAMQFIQRTAGSISSVPVLLLFKDGEFVKKHVGYMNLEDVENFIGEE